MQREPIYTTDGHVRERLNGMWTAWSWFIAAGRRFTTRADAEAWLRPVASRALAARGVLVGAA